MTKEIPLSNGMMALVDDEDFDRLSVFHWNPLLGRRGAVYATRCVKAPKPNGAIRQFTRAMQRDILDPEMKLPRSVKCDHIDHNTLNNQRSNLRLVNDSISNINRRNFRNNTTGFRGVYYNAPTGTYYAQVRSHGRRFASSWHQTIESAAAAYNRLALRHHGEHAQLNRAADGSVLDLPPVRPSRPRAGPKQQTHCLRGHPLLGDNLGVWEGTGRRYCRECKRNRDRERVARESAIRKESRHVAQRDG
jgi:hypothetical protein